MIQAVDDQCMTKCRNRNYSELDIFNVRMWD